MYDLTNLPENELDIVIQNTASKKGISEAIVEKDLWVCVALDYLFTKSPWKDSLAFKGGTSLSKAYNLIERFSEDIDLILDWRVIGYDVKEPLAKRSASQQDKLNKEMLDKTSSFLEGLFVPKLRDDLTKLVDHRIEITYANEAVLISYDNRYSDNSIIRAIRLEIGALAAWTPTETASIKPYIAEIYPEQFGSAFISVRTTTPERTFWEKATILHREAFRPAGTSIPPRMSRHYYDTYRMAKLGILDKALTEPELLTQVANFKAKFYPQKWARYDLAKIGTLRLMPEENNLPSLKQDYAKMAGMIYGEIPDFNELLMGIKEIEEKVNGSN